MQAVSKTSAIYITVVAALSRNSIVANLELKYMHQVSLF